MSAILNETSQCEVFYFINNICLFVYFEPELFAMPEKFNYGIDTLTVGNAIALAETPYYDQLLNDYPHTLLEASGTRVGLPPAVIIGRSPISMRSGVVKKTKLVG